jgi:uncharacterized protein (UPF0303 family)
MDHENGCAKNPKNLVKTLQIENNEMRNLLRVVLAGADVLDNPEWVRRATSSLKK